MSQPEILIPGSTIGIVGGGQLGRMLAIAAANLGYRVHIYSPEETPCAAEVAGRHTVGDYEDEAALLRFGSSCHVVTYEFENVPAGPMRALAEKVPVFPNVDALELSQDRLEEKKYIAQAGGLPAAYRPVSQLADLQTAIADVGAPGILKTRRFGYDGKGQVRVVAAEGAEAAWGRMDDKPSVYEAFVDFENEFSLIFARGRNGAMRFWDAPMNRHVNGILAESVVPDAGIIPDQKMAATALARSVAESLDYYGVMTMEFFTAVDGPIFNEMAPRVHNSGHWTIEGAVTSQFENHIRAICGLPLGLTDLTASRVEMTNLIGSDVNGWGEWVQKERAHLHLYNKGEIRPGRKLGHVTRTI